MTLKSLLLGCGLLLSDHGGVAAQVAGEIVGWWYSPRNSHTLDLLEFRSDGSTTLGECFRNEGSAACAARPVVQNTGQTIVLGGNRVSTRYADGVQQTSNYLVDRPDPQLPLRRVRFDTGPNTLWVYFEMPRPPERWGAWKCSKIPCD